MAVIDSQHLAVLQSHESGALVEIWRSTEARGVLDESAIVAPWLPTAPDWEDVSGAVLLSEALEIAHDGRGHTISLTIAEESRLAWLDDLAVAVVAQAWDGSAYTDRELVAWGYLAGEGGQQLDKDGNQTGRRVITYHGYWDRTRVPSHRFGRLNLAQGATVAGSSAALASVTAEAPLEYISQDDNAASKAIDGNADTAAILDVIADPAQPAIGDSLDPRILRAYAGRTVRSIGSGNEPIWIELFCGHNLTPWGTDWVSPPGMYAEGKPTIRNDSEHEITVVTNGDGTKSLRVRCKAQTGNYNAEGWIQFIVYSPYGNRPFRVAFDLKASSPSAIDARALLTITDAAPTPGERIDERLRLPQTRQSWAYDFGTTGAYGGAKFSLKFEKGQLAGPDDLYYDLSNLRISVGYMDEYGGGRLFISYDNGAGVQRTQRLAFDLTTPAWTIPADGTVIVCDDLATFKAKFDPGTRQVIQMKNLQPEWFFGPGVGKLALRYGTDPNRNQFAPSGMTTIETIDFTTNGLTWATYQGLSRQSPIGTGSLAVEDYPHVGVLPGAYGAGFVWLDLGAYKPTVLSLPMTSGQLTFTVDDPDRLPSSGTAYIGTEQIAYAGRDDQTFTITTRGANSTTAAAHDTGDAVTPKLAGAAQTGPLWDALEVRRKPGTPAILSGAVLYSNLVSPGDPSAGGAKWERHPDWSLLSRFANSVKALTLSFRAPGAGPLQARHVCLVVDRMDRYRGVPQRVKVNEIVVREWVPGASADGDWAGHALPDTAAVAAHLLTQHGGVPASKVAVMVAPAPLGDLPVAGAMLAQLIGNLEGDGDLRVWLDPYNAATVAPDPSNPQYDAREPYVTLDGTVLLNPPAGDWGVCAPVAQVRGTFRETASLRTYVIAYPDVPGQTGEVVEVRGTVRSWAEGRDRVVREFRNRNTRRTPQRVAVGPSPWARPWLRVAYTSADLDAGGQWIGVNAVLRSYRHRFTLDAAGGIVWECDLVLKETVL